MKLPGLELRERIGEGSFGIVYRAHQPATGRDVAVKVIHPELAGDPDYRERFAAEAHAIARLEHPSIVPLYEYGQESDELYLVFRWMRGGSLAAALAKGPWLPGPASVLAQQVGGALAHAHRHGIIHRDVKPTNILLDEAGDALLADFGIAADLFSETRPADRSPGSPAYMAPEQLAGGETTPLTDVYALGIVIYETLAGRHPFAGDPLPDVVRRQLEDRLPALSRTRPDVPGVWDELVWRATEKDPARRFPSAEELVAAVADAAREQPPGALGTRSGATNVPAAVSSFVGRERELREISDLVAANRLVTLTGVGGIGKTRLAFGVATAAAGARRDGGWVAELASVGDGSLVAGEVAGVFGVQNMGVDTERDLTDILCDYLAGRDLLLVLDNCEHVRAAAAGLAEALLARCPDLRILATSREILGITGEVTYPVPPLCVSGSTDDADPEAVRLFADRAAQVHRSFELTPDSRPTVGEITRRLDGLPLAIELAASRSNLLTPGEILERLQDRFRLLGVDRSDKPTHQATLRSAMDWSYDLLPDEEQALLRTFAVFAGGWTLETAEAVCAGPNVRSAEVLDLLGSLVDKSLVEASARGSTSRYWLLETVRQYGLEKLREDGEEDDARRRHASYMLDLAERGERELRGPGQGAWTLRLEAEHDNVREALAWVIESGEAETALRLVAAMAWFWWMRGYWREAVGWLHRVRAAAGESASALVARATYKIGAIETFRVNPDDVAPLIEEAKRTLEAVGDPEGVAWTSLLLADANQDLDQALELLDTALGLFSADEREWEAAFTAYSIGQTWFAKGDHERGLATMREAVDEFVRLGDRWSAAWLAFNLGTAHGNRGDLEAARSTIQQSLDLVAGLPDRWVVPHARSRLGVVAAQAGERDEARLLLDDAAVTFEQIGDDHCSAMVATWQGELLTDSGDVRAAFDRLSSSLRGYVQTGNRYGAHRTLIRLAYQAAVAGRAERAARLIGVTGALGGELGTSLSAHQIELLDAAEAAARPALGTAQYDSLCDEGSALSDEAALAYALADSDEPPHP